MQQRSFQVTTHTLSTFTQSTSRKEKSKVAYTFLSHIHIHTHAHTFTQPTTRNIHKTKKSYYNNLSVSYTIGHSLSGFCKTVLFQTDLCKCSHISLYPKGEMGRQLIKICLFFLVLSFHFLLFCTSLPVFAFSLYNRNIVGRSRPLFLEEKKEHMEEVYLSNENPTVVQCHLGSNSLPSDPVPNHDIIECIWDA